MNCAMASCWRQKEQCAYELFDCSSCGTNCQLDQRMLVEGIVQSSGTWKHHFHDVNCVALPHAGGSSYFWSDILSLNKFDHELPFNLIGPTQPVSGGVVVCQHCLDCVYILYQSNAIMLSTRNSFSRKLIIQWINTLGIAVPEARSEPRIQKRMVDKVNL